MDPKQTGVISTTQTPDTQEQHSPHTSNLMTLSQAASASATPQPVDTSPTLASTNDPSSTGQRDQKDKKYTVKFKRNRSSRACDVCHSRKVRCDAMIHIPCTNCLTFGCECKFPEPKIRKNARKTVVRDIDGNVAVVPPVKIERGGTNAAGRPISNIASNAAPSSIAASASASSSTSTSASTSKRKREPLAVISARTYKIDSSQLQDRNLSTVRFFGSSSAIFTLLEGKNQPQYITNGTLLPSSVNEALKKSKDGLDTVQLEMLRLRGAFHIPEKGLCDELVRTYFEEIYPVEPLIDKESFLAKYENGTVSLLILQSVLLAASCVSNNVQLFDSEGSSYISSSTFYRRAKALYDAGYETDPVIVVQSLVMFLRFWDGFDDVMSNTYYWTRNAISIAQGFGFHRDISQHTTSLSPTDLRLSRLLFWYLYMRDIASSIGYGRPKMIHLDDCDVKMLTYEDFPDDIPKVNVESFIQMIRVSEVASIVAQEQYSVRAERLNRKGDALAINHCDMLMSSWRSSLPPELQYSPQKESPFAVSVLNLYYYSIVCLCHRSSISKPVMINGKQYPSEGIVFKASRIIADIAAKLMKRDELKLCAAYVVPIFFNSAVTFLIHKEYGNPVTSKSSNVGYDLTSEALRQLGLRYRLALTMREALQNIESDPAAKSHLLKMIRRTPESNLNNYTDRHKDTSIPFQQTKLSPTSAVTPQVTPNLQNDNAYKSVPLANPSPQFAVSPVSMGHSQSLRHTQQPHQVLTGQTPLTDIPLQQPQQPPHPIQPASHHPQHPQQQQPQQSDIEFPDLYLFTHNLTSTNDTTFDPSELFPTTNTISMTPSMPMAPSIPQHSQLAYILQQTPTNPGFHGSPGQTDGWTGVSIGDIVMDSSIKLDDLNMDIPEHLFGFGGNGSTTPGTCAPLQHK